MAHYSVSVSQRVVLSILWYVLTYSFKHSLNFSFYPVIIHLISVFVAQTIPCNVRLAFNKITRFSVEFRALGQTYNVEVHKEYSRTRFAGAEWRRFITENGINAGVYLFFSMGDPGPRISVVHFDEGVEEYSGDEEGSDDNHPVKSTIFS